MIRAAAAAAAPSTNGIVSESLLSPIPQYNDRLRAAVAEKLAGAISEASGVAKRWRRDGGAEPPSRIKDKETNAGKPPLATVPHARNDLAARPR